MKKKSKLMITAIAAVIAIGFVVSCDDGNGTTPNPDPCADGHSYSEWVITTPATCTEDGVETEECEVCGDLGTETRPITAGHNYEWAVTVDATKTVSSLVETCTVCGDTKGSPKTHIDSIALLQTVLSGLDANTADEPYTILLNVDSLGGDAGSVGDTLGNNNTKFVNLDLSGSAITSIEEFAFLQCVNLTGIIIPDNVTSIGLAAFGGCFGLTSITIPDNVISIEESAFTECTGITSITIPDSVTEIEYGAFAGCTNLESVRLPINPAFTIIRERTFWGCESLTAITIPDSVTEIEDSAFAGSTLTTVEFKGTAITTQWDDNAFPEGTALWNAYSAGGIGVYKRTDTTTDDWALSVE